MNYDNYKDRGNISGYKVPRSNHLVVESEASGNYFVDSEDHSKILKSVDLTGFEIVTDRGQDIEAMFYDRTNDYVYLICGYGVGVTYLGFGYIDLSDDSYNSRGAYIWEDYDIFSRDVFVINGLDHYVWGYKNNISLSGNIVVQPYGESVQETGMGDASGNTFDFTQFTFVGTEGYFLWKWSNENVELWKWTSGAGIFEEIQDCGANTDLPGNKSQRAIAYDGVDNLYFVLKDTSDNNKYLHQFQISTTGLTKKGIYDISLMLDRNCSGANLEKAFDVSGSKIYQIDPSYEYLLNIAKIPLTSDERIVAITDNYLFVSGAA